MANQTITTGTPASPINYDDALISGLLDGESITINGGALKIDADTQINQQAAASVSSRYPRRWADRS